MLLKSNRPCLTAILALALPVLGISSTVTGIEANSACEVGTCTSGDLSAGALTFGGDTTGSYNFDITADGDVFDISGTYNNTFFSGTFLGFYPTVTLVSGTNAATVTLDMLQDFFYGTDATTSWSGTYNEKVPVDLSAAGTTATGQVFYSTDVDTTPESVGLLPTANGPGDYYLSGSAALGPLNGETLVSDFQYTFTFAAGSAPGTFVSSPVPEPSETIPMAIGLAGLFLFKVRRFISAAIRSY
jgi:hypothetical protein